MSSMIFTESSTPATPSSGKATVFVDTNNILNLVNDAGVVLPGGMLTTDVWTPVVADAASGGNAATATTSVGRYIKIGSLVWCIFVLVDINTTGLTAGNPVRVRGLPFTSANVANEIAIGVVALASITFSGVPVLQLDANTTAMTILNTTSGGAFAGLAVSALTSGSADIRGNIIYRAA